MAWIFMLVLVLADAGLQKRIRSAALTVALVAAVGGGDWQQAGALLQLRA